MTARPSRRPPLTILSATPDGCAVAYERQADEADLWRRTEPEDES